jgi:hypothetical protein
VGCAVVVRLLLPEVAAWLDGRELLLGAAVVGVVAAASVLGARVARARPPARDPRLAGIGSD